MTAGYKYSLEKGSKKYVCPNCGKKTFVRYLDNEVKQYLGFEFGRCDREQKCGYWRKPESNRTLTNFQSIHEKKIEYTYLSLEDVQHHYLWEHWESDNLIRFLKSKLKKDQLDKIVLDYLPCTISLWNSQATIFWYINPLERVCRGKIMLYDPMTGRRVKKPKNLITSYHSLKHKAGHIGEYNIKPCLFGAHLINAYPEKEIVAVCESEKSACIMSAIFPKYIWMATGGLQNIKEESFRDIKSKMIVLYPDLGAYKIWKEKAANLSKNGYDIEVSDLLERKGKGKQGLDIADYFITNI